MAKKREQSDAILGGTYAGMDAADKAAMPASVRTRLASNPYDDLGEDDENEDPLKKTIASFGFDQRLENMLNKAGLLIVEDVLNKGVVDIAKIPNMGKTYADKLMDAFDEIGFVIPRHRMYAALASVRNSKS